MKNHYMGLVGLTLVSVATGLSFAPAAMAENSANYKELAKQLANPGGGDCGEKLPDGTCPDVTDKTAQIVMHPSPVRQNIQMTFALGSAKLTSQATAKLDDFAGALHKVGSFRAFDIEGHTDRSGSEELNNSLSQARAQAVVDYLADKGIDRSKMHAKGLGYTKPLAGVDATDPSNRRVEVSAP